MSSSNDLVSDANKARSIVSQPFDRLRKDIDAAEAVFDGRDDKVLNIFACDAFSSGDMGNCLAVTAVERKGNADLFFVIAADFETVRAPTQIRLSDSDTTIVATAINSCPSVAFEKQACTFITR